jgi:nudix-type nucleoside diphosphatase (YffH/AdpP family)
VAERAEILGETLLAEGRFRLTRTRVEIEETNGRSRTLDHEVYHYGPAAAVLLYQPERRIVLLVKQFRVGAFLSDGSLHMIEACAGMLEGEAPEVCATREAWEETGVRLSGIRHAFDAFTSPGGMTEKISCFVAPYAAADRLGLGGGVDADESIELVEIAFDDALAAIEAGKICDAKTIGLLYYAKATGLL